MEILRHFSQVFSDGIDSFVGWFTSLFEYFIAIGVRQETLILILIGGGISFILVLVALFMAMAKIRINRREGGARRPGKADQSAERKKNTSRFSAMFKPKARDKVDEAVITKGGESGADGKGFAIFKKRKKPSRAKPPRNASDAAADNVVSELAQIERDMLALKELYQGGHITVDVYVSESRTLYEKAKSLS